MVNWYICQNKLLWCFGGLVGVFFKWGKKKTQNMGGLFGGLFPSFFFFFFSFRSGRRESPQPLPLLRCSALLISTAQWGKQNTSMGNTYSLQWRTFFSHFVEKPSSLLVPLVARKPFWIAIHSRNGIYAARGKTQPVTPPNRHRQPRLKHDTHDDM